MSATLTVRLPAETKEGLTILAEKTRRSNSFLAGEAIAAYVARELEIVNRIEAARANVRAGNFVSHETVIAEARALIESYKKKP
jgi:predicted transcriptional regulator